MFFPVEVEDKFPEQRYRKLTVYGIEIKPSLAEIN
jgi:hypothetical protein